MIIFNNNLNDILYAIKILIKELNVIRCKNTWKIYQNNNNNDLFNYTDIKLNILHSNKKYGSIIGEIQLLLDVISKFKIKSHKFYSILRLKEFFINFNSISDLLLNKINNLRKLACIGDKHGIY